MEEMTKAVVATKTNCCYFSVLAGGGELPVLFVEDIDRRKREVCC